MQFPFHIYLHINAIPFHFLVIGNITIINYQSFNNSKCNFMTCLEIYTIAIFSNMNKMQGNEIFFKAYIYSPTHNLYSMHSFFHLLCHISIIDLHVTSKINVKPISL